MDTELEELNRQQKALPSGRKLRFAYRISSLLLTLLPQLTPLLLLSSLLSPHSLLLSPIFALLCSVADWLCRRMMDEIYAALPPEGKVAVQQDGTKWITMQNTVKEAEASRGRAKGEIVELELKQAVISEFRKIELAALAAEKGVTNNLPETIDRLKGEPEEGEKAEGEKKEEIKETAAKKEEIKETPTEGQEELPEDKQINELLAKIVDGYQPKPPMTEEQRKEEEKRTKERVERLKRIMVRTAKRARRWDDEVARRYLAELFDAVHPWLRFLPSYLWPAPEEYIDPRFEKPLLKEFKNKPPPPPPSPRELNEMKDRHRARPGFLTSAMTVEYAQQLLKVELK